MWLVASFTSSNNADRAAQNYCENIDGNKNIHFVRTITITAVQTLLLEKIYDEQTNGQECIGVQPVPKKINWRDGNKGGFSQYYYDTVFIVLGLRTHQFPLFVSTILRFVTSSIPHVVSFPSWNNTVRYSLLRYTSYPFYDERPSRIMPRPEE